MFICQKCGKVVGPGVSPNIITLQTRSHAHPRREYVHKKNNVLDPGGQGTQIVKEGKYCNGCAKDK